MKIRKRYVFLFFTMIYFYFSSNPRNHIMENGFIFHGQQYKVEDVKTENNNLLVKVNNDYISIDSVDVIGSGIKPAIARFRHSL